MPRSLEIALVTPALLLSGSVPPSRPALKLRLLLRKEKGRSVNEVSIFNKSFASLRDKSLWKPKVFDSADADEPRGIGPFGNDLSRTTELLTSPSTSFRRSLASFRERPRF